MKKSVIALAAMAVVGGASAQVVISGYFGASVDSIGISTPNAARTGNTSEGRVSDQASRVVFNVTEDLGSGLKAIGQFDVRIALDAQPRSAPETGVGAGTNRVPGGNNHIGLVTEMGTLRAGRQDIYYVESGSLLPGGLFLAANVAPVLHSLAPANVSRTPNLIWYESPRFSGVQATVGYSTHPMSASVTNEVENDLSSSTKTRAGSGTYLKLNYTNGPLDAGWAYVDYKSDYTGGALYAVTTGSVDGALNAQQDQKGSTFSAKYDLGGGFKIGAARSSEQSNAVVAAAAVTSTVGFTQLKPALVVGSQTKATASNFSASYKTGSNQFTWVATKRGNLTYDGVEQASTGLQQNTYAYSYDLSKMTAIGIMYTELKNQANTNTNLFYQVNNAFGGQITTMNGEKYKITSVAMRMNF